MRTSSKGLEIIKKHEGLRLVAYFCPAGVPTIGYGHTRTVTREDVKNKTFLSLPEAEALLRQDVKTFENHIMRYVKVPMTQNQFDALVSLVYNIGGQAFADSTLLRLLNEGKYGEAADQFLVWRRGGGRILRGLVKRRAEERELFLSDVSEQILS